MVVINFRLKHSSNSDCFYGYFMAVYTHDRSHMMIAPPRYVNIQHQTITITHWQLQLRECTVLFLCMYIQFELDVTQVTGIYLLYVIQVHVLHTYDTMHVVQTTCFLADFFQTTTHKASIILSFRGNSVHSVLFALTLGDCILISWDCILYKQVSKAQPRPQALLSFSMLHIVTQFFNVAH